ncbi:uncharacterized protein PG998_002993 [Apiospora kogelbergensis]|uniref:uncharacterized protein n=1 Tax=Apiospora kogelbergensis TaxID=1337665 RepID=UPI00312D6EA7
MASDETKTKGGTRGTANAQPGLPGTAAATGRNKRSRRASDVTRTACDECKRKRTKCDGNNPCRRCTEHGVAHCHYEKPLKQSKDSLREEVDQLKRRLHHNESVLAGLTNPEMYNQVLARLRDGQSVDAISQWLQDTVPSEAEDDRTPPASAASVASVASAASVADDGSSLSLTQSHSTQHSTQYPDVTTPLPDWAGKAPDSEMPDRNPIPSSAGADSSPEITMWTTSMASYNRVLPTILFPPVLQGATDYNFMDYMSPAVALSDQNLYSSTWTNVTQDMDLIQHLLALYFCWEYPTFATIHKEYFMADFLSGRQMYCSATLVNALLALGCLFSSGAIPSDESQALSDHFFQESLRLAAQDSNQYTLTNIQSMGILAIREVRCGRNTGSRYYAGQSMRLALEMSMRQDGHFGDAGNVAVSNTTFWGAFALDNVWSMVVSNTQSVFKCFCEISQLGHSTAYLMQTPHVLVTAHALLEAYNHYLDWYNGIPEALRLGANYTPSVFVVHIYYHCAIMLLFRPYIRLRIKGSTVVPRDVCTDAADAVRALLRSYTQLYTLRHTPSFLPYLTLISSTMHLAAATAEASGNPLAGASSDELLDDVRRVIATVPLDFGDLASALAHMNAQGGVLRPELSPGVTESLEQGISDLTEMMPFNQAAKQALHALQHLHALWNNDPAATAEAEAETEAGAQRKAKPTPAFGSEFHLQAQLALASGVSLEDAGFTMSVSANANAPWNGELDRTPADHRRVTVCASAEVSLLGSCMAHLSRNNAGQRFLAFATFMAYENDEQKAIHRVRPTGSLSYLLGLAMQLVAHDVSDDVEAEAMRTE